MPNSIDFTNIDASLGAYCRTHSDKIFSKMFCDNEFAKYWGFEQGPDIITLIRKKIGSVLQQRDSSVFSPSINAIAYSNRELRVRGLKADLIFDPQPDHQRYLEWLMRRGNQNRIDFEEFLVDGVVNKVKHELSLIVWQGVYAASTPLNAMATMDGLLKIIADEITAGTLTTALGNIVNTGVITPVNVINSIESVVDALDDQCCSNEIPVCFVSPQIFTWYARAMRSDYGSNTNYQVHDPKYREMPVDTTTCTLVSTPGLTGSQRIVVTYSNNIVLGQNDPKDVIQPIRIQPRHRQYDWMLDMGAGVNIYHPEDKYFVVNDQA